MKTNPSRPIREVSAETRAHAQKDAELVKLFLKGDEGAFVEIMTRYQAKIFSVAHSLLHNRADAEEIAQDTFVRAHRCLAQFRGDSSLATWLHRIAANLAKNRYWYFFRRRRHSTLSLDFAVGEEGDSKLSDLFASSEATPAQESCRSEFSDLTTQCMELLDPVHRQILVLRNIQNLSYSEIADQLAINTGTVKSRIARARNCLRRRMAEACPEFAPDSQPEEWFEPARTSPAIFRALV